MSVSNVNYLLTDSKHRVLRVGVDLVGLLNDQMNCVDPVTAFSYEPTTGTLAVPFGAGGGGGNTETVDAMKIADVTINDSHYIMLRYDLPDNT